jgi:hypothetical protein
MIAVDILINSNNKVRDINALMFVSY